MSVDSIGRRGFYIIHAHPAVFQVSIASNLTSFGRVLRTSTGRSRVWVNTSQATLLEGTHTYTVNVVLMHRENASALNMYDWYFKSCRYLQFKRFTVRVTTPKLERRMCRFDHMPDASYEYDSTRAFPYTLKSSTCELYRVNKSEALYCLKKSLLSLGSSVALNLHQGVETKLLEQPRSRNTTGDRLDFLTPNPISGQFETIFIHHPFRYGLVNVLDPAYVSRFERRRGLPNSQSYYDLMCRHETVVFESGLHDFGFPDRLGARRMIDHCIKESCTDMFVLNNTFNQSWRLDLYSAYKNNLVKLVRMWESCRAINRSFRPIFKLAMSPHLESCPHSQKKSALRHSREKMDGTKWTFNQDPFLMKTVNDIARAVMHEHNVEVFDPFYIGLNAKKQWYDNSGVDNQHSVKLGEIVADSLLSIVCR